MRQSKRILGADLPDDEEKLAALSVARTEQLAPDDGSPPPNPDRPKARVPKKIRKLVGTPTVEEIIAVVRDGADKHGPDPQTIVAARIMYLNGSKPRAICTALRLRPHWLNPYWASWAQEKKQYGLQVREDAWTVGRNVLQQAILDIIKEDLSIGGQLRDILKTTLTKISESLKNAADGKGAVSAKELEQLAKVFKQTADVTHRMSGIGAQKANRDNPSRELWPVRPEGPLSIDVPSKSKSVP